jgi:hypothetical protein
VQANAQTDQRRLRPLAKKDPGRKTMVSAATLKFAATALAFGFVTAMLLGMV